MPDVEAFRERVKAVLDEKGLSSREVSARAQGRISNTSVLNMLRGHIPSADVLVEFAEAVGESPEEQGHLADELFRLAGKRVRYLPPSLAE